MKDEEVTYEQYVEAVNLVDDFILSVGGSPAAYEPEQIDKEIVNWPKNVQEAWEIQGKWEEQMDGAIY